MIHRSIRMPGNATHTKSRIGAIEGSLVESSAISAF
jgi:hypothetical protein